MAAGAPAPYTYTSAEVVKVVDGDTVDLRLTKTFSLPVDFGFYIKDSVSLSKTAVIRFRLNGINAPEMSGATKVAGLASKAELERLLKLGPITVVSYGQEKYGRWLGGLTVDQGDTPVNVNQSMIDGGFAKPYTVS
jgi:endonuclease YncB( thermonuclease family)